MDLVAVTAMIAVCGSAAYMGAPPARAELADYYQFLDGGWRILNGQRPHLDFYSPYGVFLYAPAVVGLAISGPDVRGLGYGNALAAFAIGLWAYFICRPRLAPSASILAALSLTLLAVAPFPLGYDTSASSCAMIYNRQCYALLGILLIEAYSGKGAGAISRVPGALSSGIVCGILLFLKPSYFVMGLCLLAAAAVIRPRKRNEAVWIVCGLGLVTMAVLCYLRFDIGPLVSDYVTVAGARVEGLDPHELYRRVVASFPQFAGLMACALLAPLTWNSDLAARRGRFGWLRCLFFASVVSAAGLCLLFTNWQPSGLPLSALTAILLASEIRPARKNRELYSASLLALAAISHQRAADGR